MKKRITAMICIAALLVTTGQTTTAEGKNSSRKLLPAKQISSIVSPKSTNHGRNVRKAENTQTLILSGSTFYNKLLQSNSGILPKSAITNSNADTNTIELNMEQVTEIQLYKLEDADKQTLQTLLAGCTNLNRLVLQECDLREFDFSALNNSSSLRGLYLYRCNLESAPNITLPELTNLCLSRNFLTDAGSSSITSAKFPKLSALYLDACGISDVSFLTNLGKLQALSLANGSLTDSSITALLGIKDTESVSSLQTLNLGKAMYTGNGTALLAGSSSNKLTNTANLALLPENFPTLTSLDLSGLKITSLEDFQNVRTNISINFNENRISNFAGLEDRTNFSLNKQTIALPGSFFKGCSCELPTPLKRILNENDVLKGTLSYTGCSLSDDKQKIIIQQNTLSASVTVNSGKLTETEIQFTLKESPVPEIPKNLTATVGDTLAQVALPDGFSWKDSTQDVGTEGMNTFQAVYTKQEGGMNYFWDVEIPVTIRALTSQTPTPTPTTPTPTTPTPTTPTPTTPVTPTQIPATQTPVTPTQVPATQAPVTPTQVPATQAPVTPTQVPATQAPVTPTQVPATPTPETPTLAPATPTPIPVPDDSKLTGNQIAKRTDLPIMFTTGKLKGKSGIQLTWNKQNNCTGYEVYWSFCNGKQNFKKLKTIPSNNKRVYIHNNLKKTRAYKYYIAAYQIKNGKKQYISKSQVIHVAMNQEKHTNVKKIKLNKTTLVLKQTKTFQMKATAIAENKKKKLLAHEPKFRYYTDNRKVAVVTKTGKIMSKKKGTCTIYVITNNGLTKTIKVTIK